jgi:hypothetical protein
MLSQTSVCEEVFLLLVRKMTDTKIECTNIKFLAKLKKTATETYQLLCEVYGEDTLSRARIFEWQRRFLGGREDVEDDERPGRPVTMKTDENVDKVRTMVRNDRRLSIGMIAEELNVDKETVRQILTENLKMIKACAKMVPKNLSEDQKLKGEEMCQNVLEKIEEDPDFLNSVVTCDETWLLQYDPETKRQSMQWKTTHSPTPKNARMLKSKIKTMLVVFFDIRGIIMTQYVLPGQTVNQTYYIELLPKLREKIRIKRLELWKNGWILHQDNAPAHNALPVQRFLAKEQVPVLHHAPYSPLHVTSSCFLS